MILGVFTSIYGFVLWANAGFPFSLGDFFLSFFISRPYQLEQDAYFLVIILGVCVSLYAYLELHLKRWEIQ